MNRLSECRVQISRFVTRVKIQLSEESKGRRTNASRFVRVLVKLETHEIASRNEASKRLKIGDAVGYIRCKLVMHANGRAHCCRLP